MSGKGMESTCKIQAVCCACFAAIQAVGISRSLYVVLLAAGADGTEAGLSAVLFPALLFGGLLWCVRNWLFGVREESCRKERMMAVLVFGVLSAVCVAVGGFAAAADNVAESFAADAAVAGNLASTGAGVSSGVAVSPGAAASPGAVASPGVAASSGALALLIELCACLASIGICRLFFSLEKAARQSRLAQEELARERLRKEQQEELAAANEEIRRLRHDMKNSYQLLLGLLQQGNAEEAMHFLQQEDRQLTKVPTVVYTDREAVNALLNIKHAVGKRNGVAFSVRVTASLAGIADYDMCHLLGNLLDNALEAAAKCDETSRAVDLRIGGDRRKCLIEIANSVSGRVLEDGKLPKTTKQDVQNHGLGYANVKAVVEQYNGSIRMEERNGSFLVVILLFRKNGR